MSWRLLPTAPETFTTSRQQVRTLSYTQKPVWWLVFLGALSSFKSSPERLLETRSLKKQGKNRNLRTQCS